MENINLSYREILPDLYANEKWTDISLNTGGTQSTLQDIKVNDSAGGFCYQELSGKYNQNRFIYWRISHDVLELSEISLDYNLYENNVRYKFTDAPILSVEIIEKSKFITILVTTVSSLHRLNFDHPDALSNAEINETKSFSIFRNANTVNACDPKTFYVFTPSISTVSPIPHTTASYLSSKGHEAYFALAYNSELLLFTMNRETSETEMLVLKDQYVTMPKMITNIRGTFVGTTITADTDYPTSLVFTNIGDEIFLMVLYRDDHLRMWSTGTASCLRRISCSVGGSYEEGIGPHSNALRRIDARNFCAFLSNSSRSKFVFFELKGRNNELLRTKEIPAPQSDLADFHVSKTRIWALWCNSLGEFSISNCPIAQNTSMVWISAAMEPPPDRSLIAVNTGVDARQAYCSYIFHPGKFDKHVIAQALVMFKRSDTLFDANLSLHILKDRVCQAVETEIQNELNDCSVSDEEYIEISTRFWERFYSCCEQYNTKVSLPLGLVLLGNTDSVCIVKKFTFSLLRPCETLEHLMLAGRNVNAENVITAYFQNNPQEGQNLVYLVKILAYFEEWLPDDVKSDFDKKLYHLEMPDVVISQLVKQILSVENNREIFPRNFLSYIQDNLQLITDVCEAIGMLLGILRMDVASPSAMQPHTSLSNTSKFLFSIGNLFGSNVGISVLSESVRQMAIIRYSLCRNLLIFQELLSVAIPISCAALETIRSQFMPETCVFVQSYFVMVWICETPVNMSHSSSLESTIKRLNLLHLTDSRPNLSAQISTAPLIRVFLSSKGLYTALSLFCERPYEKTENTQWQYTLIPIVTIVSQLIWSVSGNFIFGEWLFGSCQHIVIQEYSRLLNTWCECNNCSRQFILAVSLLDNGETEKAYDLFLQSVRGILTEPFLIDRILKSCTNLTINQALSEFYLKVIQLFEQHNSYDHIIAIADVAIGILDKTDPQLPMFQSIVFNNELILEHFDEAYHSLIFNAELSRRKDCLRQLIICLLEKNRLDLLLEFPYAGLQDEFENIVETRARSIGIEDNDLYNFLYAFHVNKNNMRKAAIAMYEQSMRLQLETTSIESLERRYESLLSCINVLYLIEPTYQWIVRPIITDDRSMDSLVSSDSDSEADDDDLKDERVGVLKIPDIKRELLKTEAHIRLTRLSRLSFTNLGVQELAHIMSACGLFKCALKLLNGFGLDISPVFEHLVAACVRTADQTPNDQWHWLQENVLPDIPSNSSSTKTAWVLLQKLLVYNEQPNSTALRKAVVNKLLNLNAFIPQWLYNSYKFSNAAELLRLFIRHSRLLEAAELAQELISAMLGGGGCYFNIKHPLSTSSAKMCIPIHQIDLLIQGLELNSSTDDAYRQANVNLKILTENYIETALKVSNDMIEMATTR